MGFMRGIVRFRILALPTAPDIRPEQHCTDPVTWEFYDRCNPPRRKTACVTFRASTPADGSTEGVRFDSLAVREEFQAP